ncbi:unnamed protein product [Brassica napus]|uniref:(rape) hypothetical protein n=1 Tax=Brassica napus TaxID=3708 RepID=A0A816Y2U9_BRANA|nr:unnamed protein product [Brassica napus]
MDPNRSAKDLLEKYQDYLKLKSRVEILQHSERHLLGDPLEESDAALNQSLWGASSSPEHHQQQQQQGMSSYQANIPS